VAVSDKKSGISDPSRDMEVDSQFEAQKNFALFGTSQPFPQNMPVSGDLQSFPGSAVVPHEKKVEFLPISSPGENRGGPEAFNSFPEHPQGLNQGFSGSPIPLESVGNMEGNPERIRFENNMVSPETLGYVRAPNGLWLPPPPPEGENRAVHVSGPRVDPGPSQAIPQSHGASRGCVESPMLIDQGPPLSQGACASGRDLAVQYSRGASGASAHPPQSHDLCVVSCLVEPGGPRLFGGRGPPATHFDTGRDNPRTLVTFIDQGGENPKTPAAITSGGENLRTPETIITGGANPGHNPRVTSGGENLRTPETIITGGENPRRNPGGATHLSPG
jgi:hypothetical protein